MFHEEVAKLSYALWSFAHYSQQITQSEHCGTSTITFTRLKNSILIIRHDNDGGYVRVSWRGKFSQPSAFNAAHRLLVSPTVKGRLLFVDGRESIDTASGTLAGLQRKAKRWGADILITDDNQYHLVNGKWLSFFLL